MEPKHMRPDDGRVVPTFAWQALRGQPLTVAGDGRQTRSLCHVDDTVRGILAVAGSGLAGPLNIGNPDEATVLQFAERIIALSGSPSGIEYVPLPGTTRDSGVRISRWPPACSAGGLRSRGATGSLRRWPGSPPGWRRARG